MSLHTCDAPKVQVVNLLVPKAPGDVSQMLRRLVWTRLELQRQRSPQRRKERTYVRVEQQSQLAAKAEMEVRFLPRNQQLPQLG